MNSPESIEKFVTALEEAEHDRSPRKILPGRQLTDPDEILTLMKKGIKRMSEQYYVVNIRVYLNENKPTYIGEENLYTLFSDFECPNPDVQHFLQHNAIEFTKKHQSVTYLIFNNDTSERQIAS